MRAFGYLRMEDDPACPFDGRTPGLPLARVERKTFCNPAATSTACLGTGTGAGPCESMSKNGFNALNVLYSGSSVRERACAKRWNTEKGGLLVGKDL